uniref:HECT-type E3 ubiquitin transferase n=1 Tax=Rhizophora mucronata TaxID=61149 RepID=A0A2P2KLS9_RHIMU
MFFTGDPTTRKRVDLGGRSSKERDRQKLLEQTRLERNRRLWLRQQNAAAIRIQKCLRGRKTMEAEHSKVREEFYAIYGKHCQNIDRHCFGPDSRFLCQLLFFFNAKNDGDFAALGETCRLLLHVVQHNAGDLVSLFAGADYPINSALVDYRVKKLAFTFVQAVSQHREQLRDPLLMTPMESNFPLALFLEAVIVFLDPKLPWACKVVGYLLQRNTFFLFRGIVLAVKDNTKACGSIGRISSLEHLLARVISHIGQKPCLCPNVDPYCSFSSQMLTIPFLWQLFPNLKEVFAAQSLSQHYIHQMALCVKNHVNVLPNDISAEYPGYACLLGNMLETAGVALSQPDCSFELAIDLAAVTTFLLEGLPCLKSSNQENKESSTMSEDDVTLPDETEVALGRDLEQQITNAIDSRFLLQLSNVLFGGISLVSGSHCQLDREVEAIGAACAFLHITFDTLPLEQIMTVLAYRTELVRVLWNFMKSCHENQRWSSLSEQLPYLPKDAPGWLLPLAVFCPVYKHMLTIVHNEEFYEQEKPLSLNDIRSLIIILRQALWQLLWVNPMAHNNSVKPATSAPVNKQNPVESIKQRVGIVASQLLSQVVDEFVAPNTINLTGQSFLVHWSIVCILISVC